MSKRDKPGGRESSPGAAEDLETFTCQICEFSIPYIRYARDDFRGEVKYKERLFFVEDPGDYGVYPLKLAVGSKCESCRRMVCLDKACSKFDRERICIQCEH